MFIIVGKWIFFTISIRYFRLLTRTKYRSSHIIIASAEHIFTLNHDRYLLDFKNWDIHEPWIRLLVPWNKHGIWLSQCACDLKSYNSKSSTHSVGKRLLKKYAQYGLQIEMH